MHVEKAIKQIDGIFENLAENKAKAGLVEFDNLQNLKDREPSTKNSEIITAQFLNVAQVTVLVKQSAEQIRKKCEYYLVILKNKIKKDQKFMNTQFFAVQALTEKWSANSFNFEEDLKALKLIGCVPPLDFVSNMREKTMTRKEKKQREKLKKFVEGCLASLTVEKQPIKVHTNPDEYKNQIQEFFEEEKSLEQDIGKLSLENLNKLQKNPEEIKTVKSDDESDCYS